MAKKKKISRGVITDYDDQETGEFIDPAKPLNLKDLGLRVPETPPTQVVSIRLPSELLNELKALGSARDIPYQALIKLFLAESVEEYKKRSA